MKIRLFKSKNLNLCVFFIFYEFFLGFLTYNLSFPPVVKYLGDAINIYLLVVSIKVLSSRRHVKSFGTCQYEENKSLIAVFVIVLLWMGLGTLSAFLNGFHLPLWIWALRNWGRLFIFLIVCIALFDENSFLRVNQMIIKLFHINFFAVVIQFFFMKSSYKQDQMNGILGGNTSGMNVMLVLCTLVIIYSGFFLNMCSLKYAVLITSEAIIVAVLAELKVLFIVIVVLFVFYAVIDMKRRGIRINVKVLILLIIIPVIILTGANILSAIYPGFDNFLQISRIIEAMSVENGGYAGTGINRLSVISVSNKYFLTTFQQRLLGIGMGNAEYSQIGALTSSFYRTYGTNYMYLGFSSADLYIEGGLLGLVSYTGIYVYILLKNFKRVTNQRLTQNQKLLNSIGYGMAMLSLIFILYGNYQRTDAAYIIAFLLAGLFIKIRRPDRDIEAK